jgi:L-iditol 2-dehydrogenase
VSATMNAAVLHGREDVRIERIEVPSLRPGEVLLRNEVALTCGTDVKVFRRGYHARMLVPPAVFGHEVAGIVERVGPGVAGLAPGARVVVANSAPCGACDYCLRGRANLCEDILFWNGAYAEFARIPARIVEKNVIAVDPGVSLRRAALTEPLACVLRGVEESDISPGRRVAVIGAGPIGLMFVVLARLRGAAVIAAGRNAGRLDKARELGAAVTVSAAEGEDLAVRLRAVTPDGRGPDVVIEAVGQPETCDAAVRAVRKGGLVNLFAGCPAGSTVAIDAQRLHYDELTIKSSFHHTPDAFRRAYRLIAEGLVDPDALITSEARLLDLPQVLAGLAVGAEGLKTAILPWPSEGRSGNGLV